MCDVVVITFYVYYVVLNLLDARIFLCETFSSVAEQSSVWKVHKISTHPVG